MKWAEWCHKHWHANYTSILPHEWGIELTMTHPHPFPPWVGWGVLTRLRCSTPPSVCATYALWHLISDLIILDTPTLWYAFTAYHSQLVLVEKLNNRSQSGLVADYLVVANGMVVMIAVFDMNTVKGGSASPFPW